MVGVGHGHGHGHGRCGAPGELVLGGGCAGSVFCCGNCIDPLKTYVLELIANVLTDTGKTLTPASWSKMPSVVKQCSSVEPLIHGSRWVILYQCE